MVGHSVVQAGDQVTEPALLHHPYNSMSSGAALDICSYTTTCVQNAPQHQILILIAIPHDILKMSVDLLRGRTSVSPILQVT
jgi:hypothetical protein